MTRRKQTRKGKPVSAGIVRAAQRAGIEPAAEPATPKIGLLGMELHGLAAKLGEAQHLLIAASLPDASADDSLRALQEVWSVKQCLGDWSRRIFRGEFGGAS